MGSEVVAGYKCKPLIKEPNKPIMYFKTQLFICTGERCQNVDLAKELRELLEELNLDRGELRIKITRTNCFGACRFKQIAQIVENTNKNGNIENNCLLLKNVDKFDKEKWKELFLALSQNRPICKLNFEFIDMQVTLFDEKSIR